MTPGPASLRKRPWRWPAPGLAAALFVFSLILFWSSGYKNVVVWGALALVLGQAAARRRRVHAGGLGLPILFLFASAVLSTVFSIDRAFSQRHIPRLLELLAGYMALVNLLPPGRRVERTVDAWIGAMGMVVLADAVRMARLALGGGSVLLDGRFYESLLGYPTLAAGVYGATVVLAVARLLGAETTRRRAGIALLLAGFAAMLYVLQTRSVLLGIAVGLLPVAALSTAPVRWKAVAAGAAAAPLVLALALPGTFRERLLQGASSDRAELWQDTRTMLRDGIANEPVRAWIGFGYGHGRIFEHLRDALPPGERQTRHGYDHAHNLLLELRVQTGILGVLAWAALLLTAAVRVVRRRPPRRRLKRRHAAAGLAGALLCLLVYGQFSVLLALQPILLFWSLLGTLMAACTDEA